MYNSIADFIRNDVKEIEGIIGKILEGTKDATDLTLDIQQRVERLGSSMIAEIYELLDNEIFESLVRKKRWYVEHKDMQSTEISTRRNFIRKLWIGDSV